MHDFTDLRRLARTMQYVLAAGAVVLALAAVWMAFNMVADPLYFMQLTRQDAPLVVAFPPSSGIVATVAAITALRFFLLFAALYCVWRMFAEFAGEEPLSLRPAIWMRRASLAFVVMAFGGILARTATVLALTIGNPPGERSLSIGFGSGELLTLLIALIMYMMGRVMVAAAEARADQKGFV